MTITKWRRQFACYIVWKGENEANNETSSGGDETDEPASPDFERHSGGAECYPMVIIDESDQLVDHAGAPATPTGSDLRAAPDRR